MLKSRRPILGDKEAIDEIAKKYDWPVPDEWASAVIIEDDAGKILAFGCLRGELEAICLVNGTTRQNYNALIEMLQYAINDAIAFGSKSIIVFAQDDVFAAVLERHFKFKKMRGTPMMLEF